MRKIEKERAEAAVENIVNLSRKIKELQAEMKEYEEVIGHFGRQNIALFTDSRLACGTGMIQIKAGTAKPVCGDGKAITKLLREKLATLLPSRFVSTTINPVALYECEDKIARQILQANGVRIVREDKFTVV